MAIAAVTLLVSAGKSSAATPRSPPSGSKFTTTDKVTFTADALPGEPDHWFFFSKGKTLSSSRYFSVPGDDGSDKLSLDLGFLISKFDHIGAYSWALCAVAGPPDYTPDMGQCSPPSQFSVRFQLSTLSGADARAAARWVMNHDFRPYWRGLSGRSIVCLPITRERRCGVFGFAGDSMLDGRITIYQRRTQTRSEPYFRGRMRWGGSHLGGPEDHAVA